jgi:hypothetical protein
LNK